MSIFLVFLMYALFAATFPIGQYALRFTTPLLLTSVRMLFAGSLLLSMSLIGNGVPRLSGRMLWRFAVLSFFYIYLAFVPELWAQQYLTPLTVNLMYSTTPLIALVLEWLLLKQPCTPLKIIAIGLGFMGMIPLFCLDAVQGILVPSPMRFLPESVLLIGVISSCYAWFMVRKLNEAGYGLLFINGIAMVMGGMMSLLNFFVLSGWDIAIMTQTMSGSCLFCIMGLILISNIIGYPLYGFLLRLCIQSGK